MLRQSLAIHLGNPAALSYLKMFPGNDSRRKALPSFGLMTRDVAYERFTISGAYECCIKPVKELVTRRLDKRETGQSGVAVCLGCANERMKGLIGVVQVGFIQSETVSR